jgi:NADH dehydrogenase
MNVALIGGTGFIGSYIVDALLEAGHEVRALVRPGSEDKLRDDARITAVAGDLAASDAVRSLLAGADAVIYLVGILRAFPKQGITFEKTQSEGVVTVADLAAELGVRRFVLMSANGVEAEATPYQVTKYEAERYVANKEFDWTVLRPSVVFGDPRGRMEFATQLYEDIVRLPVPAIGFHAGLSPSAGAVMMSPVHVTDVARAFVNVLDDPATFGKTYELGGPDALSWVEMIRRVGRSVGKSKIVLPMPIALMRVAATVLDWLPAFPVTRDQLTMLEQGNVCSDDDLRALAGGEPVAFEPGNLGYLKD